MLNDRPDSHHYQSQCAGKIKHTSQADARKAIGQMGQSAKRRGKARVDATSINVYKCKHCGGYHLGRMDAEAVRSRRLRSRCGDGGKSKCNCSE